MVPLLICECQLRATNRLNLACQSFEGNKFCQFVQGPEFGGVEVSKTGLECAQFEPSN